MQSTSSLQWTRKGPTSTVFFSSLYLRNAIVMYRLDEFCFVQSQYWSAIRTVQFSVSIQWLNMKAELLFRTLLFVLCFSWWFLLMEPLLINMLTIAVLLWTTFFGPNTDVGNQNWNHEVWFIAQNNLVPRAFSAWQSSVPFPPERG